MTELSIDHQRELIESLAQLIAERSHGELSIHSSYEARDATAEAQFSSDRQRLEARQRSTKEAVEAEHNGALADIARTFELAMEKAHDERDQVHRDAVRNAKQSETETDERAENSRQRATNDFEEAVAEAKTALNEFKTKLEERREELGDLESTVDRIVRRRACMRHARKLPEREGVCQSQQPVQQYAADFAAAKQELEAFGKQVPPKLLRLHLLIAIVFIGLVVGLVVGFNAGGGENFARIIETMSDKSQRQPLVLGLIGGGAAGVAVAAILFVLVRPIVVSQTVAVYDRLTQHLANADKSLDAARVVAVAEADTRREMLRGKLDEMLRTIEKKRQIKLVEVDTRRDELLKAAVEKVRVEEANRVATRDAKQAEVNQQFGARLREMQEQFQRETAELDERHQQHLSTSRETYERGWERLVQRWHSGLADFQSNVESMHEFCDERCPDWNSTDWTSWAAPVEGLPALRFGSYRVQLDMYDGGVPQHEDLRPAHSDFELPAVISLLDRPSLLLEAWGEGRGLANRSLQCVMLRLLTSLPPGKVRFTIVDPVGLGQNFSAFMHLADYDEKLVNHRIWTESNHINQKLADLTEHMEDVIQTYLRNEFASIDEYNRSAGEVAEPFHVLVAANFPSGFSEEAAQRLLSIVASGARCGVYALISTDSKAELPRHFDIADLEANSTTVQWDGSRFHWMQDDLKDLPLALDDPPDDSRLVEIIRTIGDRAKDAIRVEVPFSTVIPAEEQWWTYDSRAGIEVALGRAGATKLQQLALGKGTSQHVLISGKTGSGKSTLLHALIANTALHYSPDEVHLYLIDFKKGVEFKAYATHRLPHARVVAIESEREFGMSVLQRLDLELRQRGDMFREHGVQDIKNYRDANPDAKLPRILLIIDEFQEFFIQDDRIAQDAALLLDRLVRQGRAFGIHVLLGSQTLAGAYSLARSTIGQMAVRIALQCSEADSHLILSEDNNAARLLNRPGEAIYNDANGLFEGNHPFQVVWLDAGEQEQHLRSLARMASERNGDLEPTIVFEGNAPADPSENRLLLRALQGEQPASPLAIPAWLGAAVAIKDPSATVFRRQSGSNLLMVGQHEDLALGVLANAIVSLAANAPSSGTKAAKFYLLNGMRPEAPDARFWSDFAATLPIGLELVTPRDVNEAIASIERAMRERLEAEEEDAPPIFLAIHNLSRFRDLRRGEDDFGFSSLDDDDKPASPDKQLLSILREGPNCGVHSLIWCDTYNNVSRWFDRQTLRELDYRVLFQMSANDSSNLMDSPAAGRLGTHRAILYSEEQGEYEKFRPYGPPSADWLSTIRGMLEARVEPPAS